MNMECQCGKAKKGKYSADQCYPCWVRVNIKHPLPPQTLPKATEAVPVAGPALRPPEAPPAELLALVRAEQRMAKTTSTKGCTKCGKKKAT